MLILKKEIVEKILRTKKKKNNKKHKTRLSIKQSKYVDAYFQIHPYGIEHQRKRKKELNKSQEKVIYRKIEIKLHQTSRLQHL